MQSLGDLYQRLVDTSLHPVLTGRLRSSARQWHMLLFGCALVLITLTKSLFSWKTAGILTGVKMATLAVVLGLARAGLLPQWFPHWG